MQDELFVIENPIDSTKLLIGHFSESSNRDPSGFLWSDSNLERFRAMINDFDSLDFDDLLLRIKGDEQTLWMWDSEKKKWYPRSTIEILGNRFGLVGSINGVNEKKIETSEKINPDIRIPTSFNNQVKHSIQVFVNQKEQFVSVKISFRIEAGSCVVRFLTSSTQEEIHKIEVQGVLDLIRILRLTLSDRGFLRSSNGKMLVWNPFLDIEYGKLDWIRQYVETNAPRDVGRKLPQTIKDLMKEKKT
ncbi:MAG: hypothetical protein ACFFEV_00790, partial [Candidatus Thorarchaeota archaeon]